MVASHFKIAHSAGRMVAGFDYDRIIRLLFPVSNTQRIWTTNVIIANEVWDEMVVALSEKNNRVRAIAAQVLCNLAKSDPDNRMLTDHDALLAVTKEERFVTTRHCLQSLWKVGTAGEIQQQLLVDGLESRYYEYLAEKNCT